MRSIYQNYFLTLEHSRNKNATSLKIRAVGHENGYLFPNCSRSYLELTRSPISLNKIFVLLREEDIWMFLSQAWYTGANIILRAECSTSLYGNHDSVMQASPCFAESPREKKCRTAMLTDKQISLRWLFGCDFRNPLNVSWFSCSGMGCISRSLRARSSEISSS